MSTVYGAGVSPLSALTVAASGVRATPGTGQALLGGLSATVLPGSGIYGAGTYGRVVYGAIGAYAQMSTGTGLVADAVFIPPAVGDALAGTETLLFADATFAPAHPVPALAAVAARLYLALGPQTLEDETYGWVMRYLCNALTQNLQDIEDLAGDRRDTPYRDEYLINYGVVSPGWSQVYDTWRCPDRGLPYLGQFVGVEQVDGETPDELRDRIRDAEGWRRGTPAAIEKAGRRFMTGTKTIRLTERVGGHAYRLGVTAARSEIPDVSKFMLAVQAAVPAGIIIEFNIPRGWRWVEFDDFFVGDDPSRADWADVDTYYAAVDNPVWAQVDERPHEDEGVAPEIGLAWLVNVRGVLMADERRFRFAGVNIPWLGRCANGDGVPHVHSRVEIADAIGAAKAMGATVVRSHSLGVSLGSASAVVTGYSPDSPLRFAVNPQAWDPIDYTVFHAGVMGVRLMIPLVDWWRHFYGGKSTFVHWLAGTAGVTDVDPNKDSSDSAERIVEQQFYTNPTVVALYKAYITYVLNHINPYTGKALKDDPTCAIWQIGADLEDEDTATGWVEDIAAHIKSLSPHCMVADGMMTTTRPVNLSPGLAAPHVDIVGISAYGALDTIRLEANARDAATARKAFVVDGWSWNHGNYPDYLATVEDNRTISGDIVWSLVNPGENLNTASTEHPTDDVALYYPTNDPTMAAFISGYAAHAARMDADVDLKGA